MVIDTSAIAAILFVEEDALAFARAIEADPVRRISAATLLEAAIVVETRHGLNGTDKLDQFLDAAGVQVVAVTEDQVVIARLAYRIYGKGRHPAALNFGDCFSYALAQSTSEPLLFKGSDFAQTDVKKVLA
jgi:ribonuclease VapC